MPYNAINISFRCKMRLIKEKDYGTVFRYKN